MNKKLSIPLLMTTLVTLFACGNTISSSSSEAASSSETSSESSVSSIVSSESSETTSVSSEVSSEESSTSVTPTENLVEVFNYGFDAAYVGDPAINAPEEGEGFIITDGGYATTINGALEPAPAPGWTFAYGSYDLNMPEFELEAKVRFGASTNNTAVFDMRTCYDGCYDVQFSAKNNENGWQGVQIHQAGGSMIAQHDDPTKGGLITDGSLTIVPDTDYIFKFRSMIDENGNARVSAYVNGVKVIEISGLSRSTLNANAKHGMGVSAGTWANIDYYKGSNVIIS